jgi:hypothetical protein
VHAAWTDSPVHNAENRIGHQLWFFNLNLMAGLRGEHLSDNTERRHRLPGYLTPEEFAMAASRHVP